MKRLFLLSIAILAGVSANAQDKKEQDQKAIKEMCGCYEVSFNFKETFNYVNDTTYVPSETKQNMRALEWVELVEDQENLISMQHLLIVGSKDSKHIIKHWRQDWDFENTDFHMYNGDNHWQYKANTDTKGQWTQSVYQVDDSPRYTGSSSWVHVDGKSYWENETPGPLPRREYTQRSDYNITLRRNRHELVKEGWVHDQDNDKVLREDGKDSLIAQEKGYNTYTKVDDAKCKAAQDWWKKNKEYWALVREVWTEVFAEKKDLKLAEKVEGKRLYEVLFDMDLNSNKKKIKKVINSFII